MATLRELRQAVEDAPDDLEARWRLGRALLRRHEVTEGVACWREVIARRPDDVERYVELGDSLMQLAEPVAAADSLGRALALDPRHPRASLLLAWLYITRLDRVADAQPLLPHAIAHSPSSQAGYTWLCRTCIPDRAWREAHAAAAALMPLTGDPRRLRLGLALALMHVGRYADARDLLEEMLRARPDDPEATVALARCELAVGDRDRALAIYQRAHSAHPGHPLATIGLAEQLFRLDDLQGARRACGDASSHTAIFGLDAGSALDRRSHQTTFLLHQPGGYGDSIQLIVFALLLARRGARVIFECPTPLKPLFADLRGLDRVIAPHDEDVIADVTCRLEQVWMGLDWQWDEVSSIGAYIRPPERRVCAWERQLHADDRLRVGLVWRTGYESATHQDPFSSRSIPVAQLARFAAASGVAFYGLGLRAAGRDELARIMPSLPIVPLDDGQGDFMETAAAIEAVDLVITADTAAAHLAGVMRKPCVTLLPYLPFFRWGSGAERTRWYPETRLVRQETPGDWGPVLDRVAAELPYWRARLASCRALP